MKTSEFDYPDAVGRPVEEIKLLPFTLTLRFFRPTPLSLKSFERVSSSPPVRCYVYPWWLLGSEWLPWATQSVKHSMCLHSHTRLSTTTVSYVTHDVSRPQTWNGTPVASVPPHSSSTDRPRPSPPNLLRSLILVRTSFSHCDFLPPLVCSPLFFGTVPGVRTRDFPSFTLNLGPRGVEPYSMSLKLWSGRLYGCLSDLGSREF